MADKIDAGNKYMVSSSHGGKFVSILFPPQGVMSTDDAVLLAAWLVAIADPLKEKFGKVLKAVEHVEI